MRTRRVFSRLYRALRGTGASRDVRGAAEREGNEDVGEQENTVQMVERSPRASAEESRGRTVKLRHSRAGTPKHTQAVIDATWKDTAIDQQQHSCETLICQRHQTTLRLSSSAATASTRWRVHEP